ncbi:MAG: hypothetical protein AAGB19_13075 [Cyanobacteria bacterium P01_F01_bin.3]
MQGEFWKINGPLHLKQILSNLEAHHIDAGIWPLQIQVKKYEDPRSLDQNSLINAMYGQIAKQMDGEGVVDVRRRCKLQYGVPIMRAYSDEFRERYDLVIKPHTYEVKLLLMDDFKVTSKMKKPQATEYIDTVMREHPRVRFQVAA